MMRGARFLFISTSMEFDRSIKMCVSTKTHRFLHAIDAESVVSVVKNNQLGWGALHNVVPCPRRGRRLHSKRHSLARSLPRSPDLAGPLSQSTAHTAPISFDPKNAKHRSGQARPVVEFSWGRRMASPAPSAAAAAAAGEPQHQQPPPPLTQPTTASATSCQHHVCIHCGRRAAQGLYREYSRDNIRLTRCVSCPIIASIASDGWGS